MLSTFLLVVLVLELMGVGLLSRLMTLPYASAAVVTIDDSVSGVVASNNHTGAQTVFVDDVIGYSFYRDANGSCAYRKTTNNGDTWGSTVTVDAQTDCVRIVVWYDQWTPGDTGSNIHIATMDTSDAGLFYNVLDTSTDTLLLGSAPVNATVNSSQVPTYSVSVNTHAITKATNGAVFLVGNDNSDSFVVSCSISCATGTNWNENVTTSLTSPLDNRNDHNLLMPLPGGDVLLINRDISTSDIRSKVWNGTTWSNNWTLVDGTAPNSTLYDGGMSATVNLLNNQIYLAYATDNNILTDDNDDIRTAIYDGSAWTTMSDVLTDATGRGLVDVAIAVDQNNGHAYVAYTIQDTGGTAATANIYYKESTNAMTSWGAETGPINSTPGSLYKPAVDPSNVDRLYVSWFQAGVNDRFGETLDNIGPDSTLSAAGSQIATVRADTTNNYFGGQFVVNSLNANSISSITVSESGTVDAAASFANMRLRYDIDSSMPYNCMSEFYDGTEPQFGGTIAGGFDAPDGSATFAGSIIGVGPTQAVCLYVVADVTTNALDGATVSFTVSDPPNDVVITGSDIAPVTAVSLVGDTTVVSPELTQTGFHWRNDDGSEAAAASATGGVENENLPALTIGSSKRLRFGVAAAGSTSTEPISYQLQFAAAAPTCQDITAWTNVDAVTDEFNMQTSVNFTDGDNTTNIAVINGGVTDGNPNFVSPNAGLQDVGDTTSSIVLTPTQFTELEFSIVAGSSAVEGTTYCFRLSDAGVNLNVYDTYPQATINSEVTVQAVGTQTASVNVPVDNFYYGGAFAVIENVGSRNVTSVTITQSGTVAATGAIDNLRLQYDLDQTAPYNCVSESFDGTEPQFGATIAGGMSAANGSSTFSGSENITLTRALCLYVVSDITGSAANNETIAFSIESATDEVSVSGGGSVSPSNPVTLGGETIVRAPNVTQTHYHWRTNSGSESTANSATIGLQDTPLTDFQINTPIRLRLQLSNQGAAPAPEAVYDLEFAKRITTCEAIASWTSVDALVTDDFDMLTVTGLTHGADTTNIPVGGGGVTDENAAFLTPNGGVRELTSNTASTTLTQSDFVEFEFSLTTTVATAFDTDYCFRVSVDGVALPAYDSYPQLSTASKRDYKVQRGNTILNGATATLVAGVDYVAPTNPNTAFLRITNTHYTGAGDTSNGGSQDVEETTVYITNPDNLGSSITFARDRNINDTFIDWEIIEFIAEPGTDNEMIVQNTNTINMTIGQTTVSGDVVTVNDPDDVVVYITGGASNDTSNDFYAMQVTAEFDSVTNRPVFTRGATGNATADISYAVVEYTGRNWNVQRVEHTYTNAGVIETSTMTPVTSLSQTFIHAQKRTGAQAQVGSFGHTVFLSSIGAVSFALSSDANMAITHTSVAWVIENQQTGVGQMRVERQNGDTIGGAEPAALSFTLTNPLDALNNSSIFGTTLASGINTAHPRAIAGLRITSLTTYQIWRSDTGSQLQYRTEIVQWPVADLAIRQNYYRLYVDNNQLTPTDPWPEGAEDLGENTSITNLDQPPGLSDVVRVRMTLRAKNANWPADFYAFKMQYSERVSTCTAAVGWNDVGQSGSAAIWRGFAAPGTVDGTDVSTDPPTPGDLLISVADVAGSLVHQNQSATNTYVAFDGEDVEYDWYVQHNGAEPDTTYCFRVVESDGTALSGYLQYPQIRTADFSPAITGWRWYDDEQNETPSSPAAALNSAPTEIATANQLALRVVVDEQKNVTGTDVKFKLQYSTDSLFSNPLDVTPAASCTIADEWCYAIGGGVDNARITTAVTGIADDCVSSTGVGCGTHNTTADYAAGHDHVALAAQEYSFTVESKRLRSSAVYYFRLYDVASAKPVGLFTSATFPAAVAESARLVFTVDGVPAATNVAGVTTDVTTTATAVPFGRLPVNAQLTGAQQLAINTNAIEGYQVWKLAGQLLTNGSGVNINNITSSNAAPTSWSLGCVAGADGCVGYHTTDATLAGGSARFAATDTYAALDTQLQEIMFSSIPVDETHQVLYRVYVSENQQPGDYTTNITYIATPVF